MARGEVRNPVTTQILVLVTCGLYGFVWYATVAGELNEALGEERQLFRSAIGTVWLCAGNRSQTILVWPAGASASGSVFDHVEPTDPPVRRIDANAINHP